MPDNPTFPSMPLTMSAAGARVKITAVIGACSNDSGAAGHQRSDIARKIADMGLHPGVHIDVRQREGHALVISTGHARYALGVGMAHRIMVQPA